MTFYSFLNKFYYQKRSIPELSDGIGAFLPILTLISQSSIVINVLLIVFTQKKPYKYIIGEDKSNISKILLFYGIAVIIEHSIILLKVLLSEII